MPNSTNSSLSLHNNFEPEKQHVESKQVHI